MLPQCDMCITMAGRIAIAPNLLKSYHQINFSSMDKQLLVLWIISWPAGNQLQMLVRPVTCRSIDMSDLGPVSQKAQFISKNVGKQTCLCFHPTMNQIYYYMYSVSPFEKYVKYLIWLKFHLSKSVSN